MHTFKGHWCLFCMLEDVEEAGIGSELSLKPGLAFVCEFSTFNVAWN